jgi:tRNA nucleotidyltransferase (CCA-adding enzyme)
VPGWDHARPSEWTEALDAFTLLAVYAVYLLTSHPALKDYLVTWRYIRPTITGDDLNARGLTPGPEFKRILSRLRVAWLDGEVHNVAEETRLLESLL